MKMQVTFKDPDTTYEALVDETLILKRKLQKELGLTEAGAAAEAAERMVKMNKLVDKFVDSEYVTIEFDDEAGTATVVPV